jgi:hypothetical protein
LSDDTRQPWPGLERRAPSRGWPGWSVREPLARWPRGRVLCATHGVQVYHPARGSLFANYHVVAER